MFVRVEASEQSLAQNKHSTSTPSVIVTSDVVAVRFICLLAVAHSRPGEALSGLWPQPFAVVLMGIRALRGQQMAPAHQGFEKVPRMEIPWSPGDASRPRTIPGARN